MECRADEKSVINNHAMNIGRVLFGEFEKIPKSIKDDFNITMEINGMIVSVRPITENDAYERIIMIDKKQEIISKRLDNLLGLG